MQRRQTVFYTPETLAVVTGDQITGELSCAPNARNPRDLDIVISYKAPNEVTPTTIQYKMCVIRFCLWHLRTNGHGRTLTGCQVLINFAVAKKIRCHATFGLTRITPGILIALCHLTIAHATDTLPFQNNWSLTLHTCRY